MKRQDKSQKCNHDPNLKDTSLKRLNKRIMIHPELADFFCPICKRAFRFEVSILNGKREFINTITNEMKEEMLSSDNTKTKAKED